MSEETKAIKLCKDCLFMVPYDNEAFCTQLVKPSAVDYVYGSVIDEHAKLPYRHFRCKTNRDPEFVGSPTHCGPEARFFQPDKYQLDNCVDTNDNLRTLSPITHASKDSP